MPEDVFCHFNRTERRERYLREEERRVGGVISLDTETSAEQPLYEILTDANISVEQAAVNALMLMHLREILHNLPEDDVALIQALYFDGKTGAQWANEIGLTRQAIHKKKLRILGQLKKFLET